MMKIPLKAQHLKRFKDIALLLFKYAHSDVVRDFGAETELNEKEFQERGGKASPDELVADLERMGPTFVKLGQLLSSRVDLLPEPFLKALSRLQDQVKPFPYEQVEEIVIRELGVRISKGFSRFDREPLAAASLGQVHRAALRNGREVVVKVQRPDIRKQISEDFEVLGEIASLLNDHTSFGRRYQLRKIFNEFRHAIINEIDYEREAANLVAFAENLKDFENIQIPAPIQDYTTSSVLTMDYIPGKKITEMGPLARLDINGAALAEELFKAYLKQILVDGLFHADPHPGNVFLMDDGRIALIDLGLVGRVSHIMQEQLVKILIAVSEAHGDEAADVAIRLGETVPEFNEREFRAEIGFLISEKGDTPLKQIDVGKTLLELGRSAGKNGLMVPTELTLLGKTMLQLDVIGKTLEPDFNPNAAVRRNVTAIMQRRMRKHLTPGKAFGSFLELKEFMGALPSRLNKILEALSNAELEVRVKATDANLMLQGFQKIANRITMGLILASLIIGASLLMHVQTSFRLFGYPGLAILCFIAAAGGGFYLVISIMLSDHRDNKKR